MIDRFEMAGRCACLLVLATSLGHAADLPAIDYSQGVKWFPKFWRAYQMPQIPSPNLTNGRQLAGIIQGGKIELSLSRLNTLVEENSLDLMASRYNVDIAETDILRAKSGQAARGAPGAPLPVEIFSGAIGAGVGGASGANTGGTGPSAISAAAREVILGPSGVFDPDISIGASFDRSTSPLNTRQVAGVDVVTAPSTAVLMRFEKSFATGFSFNVSFNSQRQSSTQQFLLFNPAYTSRLSVAMYQPLLRGFGLALNRRFISLAKNDAEISRKIFEQAATTDLVNAQNAYWDLVGARKSVEAAQEALNAAQRLYENTVQQEQQGVSAPLDVTQSRSATAGSRRDLIIAQTTEKTRELQLKALISKSLNPLSDLEVVTADPLPEPNDSEIPTVQQALQDALSHRPELAQADVTLRNQRIAVAYTKDFLRPSFGVYALYASTALTSGIGPMLRQAWQTVPFPEYAAGFSFSISLRNRSAQADNIRAQLELQQQQASRVRTENQIRVDVETAVTVLTQAKAQVEAAKPAVEASKAALDAETTKLRTGISTPYLVIQFERDYVAAQSQEIQAQANYAKARVQLDRVRGTLLEHNNLSLSELLGSR